MITVQPQKDGMIIYHYENGYLLPKGWAYGIITLPNDLTPIKLDSYGEGKASILFVLTDRAPKPTYITLHDAKVALGMIKPAESPKTENNVLNASKAGQLVPMTTVSKAYQPRALTIVPGGNIDKLMKWMTNSVLVRCVTRDIDVFEIKADKSIKKCGDKLKKDMVFKPYPFPPSGMPIKIGGYTISSSFGALHPIGVLDNNGAITRVYIRLSDMYSKSYPIAISTPSGMSGAFDDFMAKTYTMPVVLGASAAAALIGGLLASMLRRKRA